MVVSSKSSGHEAALPGARAQPTAAGSSKTPQRAESEREKRLTTNRDDHFHYARGVDREEANSQIETH